MDEPQQFLIYQSEDGTTRIDVMLEAETLWLNQKQLTELFGKAKGTISEHIRHIFEDGEWTPEATVRLFRTAQIEGKISKGDPRDASSQSARAARRQLHDGCALGCHFT